MMADLASARVKEAINGMIEDIDRNCTRDMQGTMHRCSAKCCENSSASMEEVNHCIENCSKPMTKAQAFMQNEFSNYQDRIQRCMMQCQDTIRDKIPLTPTEAEIDVFKRDFERCIVTCADTHIDLVPTMLKRIKEVLKKSM